MTQRKRVFLSCHGLLSAGPTYSTPWEDVWMRFKTGKPRKVTTYLAPCLESKSYLLGEIAFEEWCIKENRRVEDAQKDLTELQTLLVEVEANGIAIDRRCSNTMPSLITSADEINRREAEWMMAYWLAADFGIVNPKFVWKRNKDKFVLMPMSFGSPVEPEVVG